MHSTDTKSLFLELRAKGWSLARISKQIDVSVRTLVDWNRQHRDELRTLRAIEIEALQEKLLATHEQELASHTALLNRIDNEIATRSLILLEAPALCKLAAATRAEIRKIIIPTTDIDQGDEPNPDIPSTSTTPNPQS